MIRTAPNNQVYNSGVGTTPAVNEKYKKNPDGTYTPINSESIGENVIKILKAKYDQYFRFGGTIGTMRKGKKC